MVGGDLGGLFQQAQKMQKELKAVQEDLKQRTVSGESGSGLVKVYASGAQEVMKIEIDPSAVDPEDTGDARGPCSGRCPTGVGKSQGVGRLRNLPRHRRHEPSGDDVKPWQKT